MPPSPEHIILHPGFHKTGTSSLQKGLERNRLALSKVFDIAPRHTIRPLCRAVARFEASGDPLDLERVALKAALLVQNAQPGDRALVISHENLCGKLPGRDGKPIYAATRQALMAMIEGISYIFPDCRLTFFFTIRDTETWLPSCYWQLIRHQRVGMDVDSYVRKYSGSFDPAGFVASLADALPQHRVIGARMEEFGANRLGPLDPLLDLTEISDQLRAGLKPPPKANQRHPKDIRDRLYELDRSDLSDAQLRDARRELLQNYALMRG